MPFLSRLGRVGFNLAHRILKPWLPQHLGHYYSPVPDMRGLAADRDRLWPERPCTPGIDFNQDAQAHLLREVFPALVADFAYPDEADDASVYHLGNTQFSEADGRALFALLRHWRPQRLIEVGSGFSTLLCVDVKRRFLGDGMHVTAIEPFPRPFLHGLAGIDALRVERVQDTPPAVFAALQSGDVLFIDGSHVLKTGSDLVHLLTQVLPSLASGVRVHLHDVFLPDEYPPHWVLGENRGWNEQYALQAMLAHNPRYRILYGTQFALTRLAEDARAAFGALAGQRYAGGSFWFEVG